MVKHDGIMMIEPQTDASPLPVIDELTRKMAGAWRNRKDSEHAYRGYHTCRCGATSDSHDHYINGVLTNSLCVHYLAHHRDGVPESELAKVRVLPDAGVTPKVEELQSPKFRWGTEKRRTTR
jgi:hypothetical protein